MSIDRRAVLKGVAAMAASTSAMAQNPADTQKSDKAGDVKAPADVPHPNRIVTLEEHFFDLSLVEGNPVTKQAAAWLPPQRKAQLGDLGDGRLRDMDAHGITVQVISASAPGADLFDGEEGIRFAKTTNDRLADAVRRHPNRFAGFAHLPMRAPEAAADELERAVSRLGFRGALINGTTQGRFLDDPRFAPILARAAALGVPIYLHPGRVPKPVFDAYYAGLSDEASLVLSAAGYGWHAEVAVHIFRMAFAGTFEKHPGLNVIVGHMGETLPFALDRMDHVWVDMSHHAPLSKIILERVFITTAGVFSTPAFLCALTTFGADRILFSVDYPYSPLALAMKWLEALPVSKPDRLKIEHGNADKLLKLGDL